MSQSLDDLQQRLGVMRDSWRAAESRRLHALVEAARRAAGQTASADVLRQIAELDPELLACESELAALTREAESLIDRCRHAAQRPSPDAGRKAPGERSDR